MKLGFIAIAIIWLFLVSLAVFVDIEKWFGRD